MIPDVCLVCSWCLYVVACKEYLKYYIYIYNPMALACLFQYRQPVDVVHTIFISYHLGILGNCCILDMMMNSCICQSESIDNLDNPFWN